MKNNKKITNFLTKVIILITFVIIFSLYKNNLDFFRENVVLASNGINPVISVLSSFQLWLYDFFHFNKIRNNYLKLKAENLALIKEISSLQSLKEENQFLKEALKIKENKKWHLVGAKILLIDPSGLNSNFWIDKGLEDGLSEGMNVITSNEVLVGRVIKCFKRSCLIESIFSPLVKISVEDQRSKVLAVIDKDFKGNFYLKLVPPMADIEKDDILLTSAENPYYLKGLLVAKIKDKIKEAKEEEKKYLLEPLLNLSKLEEVLIVTDFTFK